MFWYLCDWLIFSTETNFQYIGDRFETHLSCLRSEQSALVKMGFSWYIVVEAGSAKVYKDGLALARTGGEEYGRVVNISSAFHEQTKKFFIKVRFEVSISLPPCQ